MVCSSTIILSYICIDSSDSNYVGYLKLFQLADNPEIKEYYDCILVDEAQDLTPG